MRLSRILNVALLCAAIVGVSQTVYAQLPMQPGTPPPVSKPIPGPHAGPALPAPVVQPGVSSGTSCYGACPTKKLCIAEPDKKVITHVKYRCQRKTICLPNCSCSTGCGSCESSCD